MKYFKLEEFDSSDEPGSGAKMHEEILHMLDAVRKEYGSHNNASEYYSNYPLTNHRNKSYRSQPKPQILHGHLPCQFESDALP